MGALCECLGDEHVFLGCAQKKEGELEYAQSLYLMKHGTLKVLYPTGQFEVEINFCPLCGRRLKDWGEKK